MTDIEEILRNPTARKEPVVKTKKKKAKHESLSMIAIQQSIDIMNSPERRAKRSRAGKSGRKTRMASLYTWRNLYQYRNKTDEELMEIIRKYNERVAAEQTSTPDQA